MTHMGVGEYFGGLYFKPSKKGVDYFVSPVKGWLEWTHGWGGTYSREMYPHTVGPEYHVLSYVTCNIISLIGLLWRWWLFYPLRWWLFLAYFYLPRANSEHFVRMLYVWNIIINNYSSSPNGLRPHGLLTQSAFRLYSYSQPWSGI